MEPWWGSPIAGAIGYLRADGSWLVLAADGTDHVLKPSGQRWIDYRPDGGRWVTCDDGAHVTWDVFGTPTAVVSSTGAAVAFTVVAGGARVFDPAGLTHRDYRLDGTISGEATPFGSGVTRIDGANGSYSLVDPRTGTTVCSSPDSLQEVTISYGSNGVVLLTRPDGSVRRTQEDGSILERSASGAVISIVLSDGTQAVHQVDGTWTATDGSGAVHSYRVDGTSLSLEAPGVTTTWSLDGSYTRTLTDRVESHDETGRKARVDYHDGRVDLYQYGRLWKQVAVDGGRDRTGLGAPGRAAVPLQVLRREPGFAGEPPPGHGLAGDERSGATRRGLRRRRST